MGWRMGGKSRNMEQMAKCAELTSKAFAAGLPQRGKRRSIDQSSWLCAYSPTPAAWKGEGHATEPDQPGLGAQCQPPE
jgi:hypothetical protein